MGFRAWVLVGTVLAAAAADPGTARGESAAGRRVLGALRVWGPVEARTDAGEWRAVGDGALLAGTEIRTGSEGRAAFELANGDVAALGGASSVALVGDETPRLRLTSGRLGVRFQPSSSLLVDTPAATVGLPALRPVAVGGLREALLTLGDRTTTVRSFHGTLEATRPGSPPVMIAANESVTIGADAGAPPAPAAGGDIQIPPGPKSDDGLWAALGLSPGMAAVLGGALAVGGGVGGAAAAGAFSGESSETSPAPDQGSPFRPIRR